jgi:nuclear transport factor 2 (NTF2) superfamily protein
VKFEYEWPDDSGQWYRAYGNEQWEFDQNGLMKRREASIAAISPAKLMQKYSLFPHKIQDSPYCALLPC